MTLDNPNEITERWLRDARIELAERVFEPAGYTVPVDVRLRVGAVPGTRGTSRKTLGMYVPAAMCDDGVPQIYVSPLVNDAPTVLAVLVHEIVHSIVPGAKHGPDFRKVATTVGLTGPMTSTEAGDTLRGPLADIARDLGAYPHGAIDPSSKKQTTRQLRHECPECHAIFRAPRSNPIPWCAGGNNKEVHAVVATIREENNG